VTARDNAPAALWAPGPAVGTRDAPTAGLLCLADCVGQGGAWSREARLADA